MYKDYFGFREIPFSIAPDPRYLYMSEQHREALAHLLYGVRSEGGFVLLTGEVGTGKTTVCRCLMEQIPENVDVALIFNPKLTVEELLSTICDELGIRYPKGNKSIKVFTDLINAHLLEAYAHGHSTLLIIDEAQNLSRGVLEQIRLLTNLETYQRKLLQIVLIGQPELLDTLAEPKLRQLSQRIIARYHLGPLSQDDLEAYVNHRLSIAGASAQLFPKSTISKLYRLTGGIPRLINTLCDRALLGTYAQGKQLVDTKTLEKAALEVSGDAFSKHNTPLSRYQWVLAGVAVLVVAASLLVGQYYRTRKPASESILLGERERKEIPSVQRRPIPNLVKPAASELIAEILKQDPPPSQENESSKPDPTPTVAAVRELAPLQQTQSVAPKQQEAKEEQVPPGSLTWLEKQPDSKNPVLAFQTLFMIWGTDLKAEDPETACKQAGTRKLQCLKSSGNMEELRALNSPAILKLYDNQGAPFYGTLTQLKDQGASLVMGNEIISATLDELASKWKGEYTLLWRIPPDYHPRVKMGDNNPFVKWLAAKLARVDGRKLAPKPDTVFDESLVQEVKQFQLSKGLKPDGKVGPKTLICLINETSGNVPRLEDKKKDG